MKRYFPILLCALVMTVGANAQNKGSNSEKTTTESEATESQATEGKASEGKFKEKASGFFKRIKEAVEEGGTKIISTAIGPGASQKSEPKVDTTSIGNPMTLKLGINAHDVPLAGSPGSSVYNQGVQEGYRQPVNSQNRDATRFLEKAVEENNVERARKLLDAGASAYVNYSMIDNKQYEIMDAMHKNNPKLIRYSQLIHYACAHSDSKMVDFLIERGASLDLCGDYLELKRDPDWGYLAFQRCNWNNDHTLRFTPQDVAFAYHNTEVLKHITQKYGKRPTVFGFSNYIYELIKNEHNSNKNAEEILSLLQSGDLMVGDGEVGTNALKEIINTPCYSLYRDRVSKKYLLVAVIEFLGRYHKSIGDANRYQREVEKLPVFQEKVKVLEKLLYFLLDNGADVNVYDEELSILYIGVGDSVSIRQSAMMTAVAYEDMLDIIRLLKRLGATTDIEYVQRGQVIKTTIEKAKMRDEYRELLLTGELWD